MILLKKGIKGDEGIGSHKLTSFKVNKFSNIKKKQYL